MPQCPHCSASFEEGVGHLCPQCGQDTLLPPAASAPRPFTLGPPELEASSPPPPLPSRSPAPRMVSTSGPAVPVHGPRSDVAANGWGAQPSAQHYLASAPPPLPGDKPPPLPLPRAGTPSKHRGEELPAHLRIAELAAAPSSVPSMAQSQSLDLAKAISSTDLDIPEVPRAKRGFSDRWVKVGLALVVAGALGGAFRFFAAEPPPPVQVDPELVRQAEARRRAVEQMETGHEQALQGEHEAAARSYRAALELEPNLPSAERGLAIALTSLGHKDEAVAHYRKYLELSPDAEDAGQVKKIIRDWERNRKRP